MLALRQIAAKDIEIRIKTWITILGWRWQHSIHSPLSRFGPWWNLVLRLLIFRIWHQLDQIFWFFIMTFINVCITRHRFFILNYFITSCGNIVLRRKGVTFVNQQRLRMDVQRWQSGSNICEWWLWWNCWMLVDRRWYGWWLVNRWNWSWLIYGGWRGGQIYRRCGCRVFIFCSWSRLLNYFWRRCRVLEIGRWSWLISYLWRWSWILKCWRWRFDCYRSWSDVKWSIVVGSCGRSWGNRDHSHVFEGCWSSSSWTWFLRLHDTEPSLCCMVRNEQGRWHCHRNRGWTWMTLLMKNHRVMRNHFKMHRYWWMGRWTLRMMVDNFVVGCWSWRWMMVNMDVFFWMMVYWMN